MQETRAQSLGREDPLEKETATHSSILAWEIPWTGSLGGYSPWGYKELDTTERMNMHVHIISKHIEFANLFTAYFCFHPVEYMLQEGRNVRLFYSHLDVAAYVAHSRCAKMPADWIRTGHRSTINTAKSLFFQITRWGSCLITTYEEYIYFSI